MSNILIRTHQPLKRIIALRRTPTHAQNGQPIHQQPNVKVKLDRVDTPTIHHDHQLLVLDQVVIAIVLHHPDGCHMDRVIDIIHTMFENDAISADQLFYKYEIFF